LLSHNVFKHILIVSDVDLVKLVKTSKSSFSPADPITVYLLGVIFNCLCLSVTQTINPSFLSGVVSVDLKAVGVRSILPKAGSDHETISSSQSIRLLLFLSKIVE